MNIPNDPFILLSYINTLLRDNNENLEDLCKSFGLSQAEIEEKLSSVGFKYVKEQNCFK